MATVANRAVRLSIGRIGLRVVQKSDANGHHKVGIIAKITILYRQICGCRPRNYGFIQSASRLVCPSLTDAESFKIFDSFKTFMRRRPKL